jgi:hypothetical protein
VGLLFSFLFCFCFRFRFRLRLRLSRFSSPDGIDLHQTSLSHGVKRPTAPWPILRMLHQLSRYRVRVHVFELLANFLLAPHIEVIKSGLPETRKTFIPSCKCEAQLPCRRAPYASPEIPRNALLQHFQDDRWRGFRRFADEQVHVIGHDHVADQQEIVPFTNLAESVHEKISPLLGMEQRQPPITTEREEVQITSSIVTFQSLRHDKTPTRKPDAWGTPRFFKLRCIATVVSSVRWTPSREKKTKEPGPPVRWEKHCAGVLCLDNAFALIEGHPPPLYTFPKSTAVIFSLRSSCPQIKTFPCPGHPPASRGWQSIRQGNRQTEREGQCRRRG